MEDQQNDKHKFLLSIDKSLWEKFMQTVPINLDATKALTQMIQERVNYLEQHWREDTK